MSSVYTRRPPPRQPTGPARLLIKRLDMPTVRRCVHDTWYWPWTPIC